MSLRKKNTRIIKVSGVDFRWTISAASHQITFVAESANTKGRKIKVIIASDIDRFWVEFPKVDNLNLKVITPKDAENIITIALKSGWLPSEKVAPMKFEFIDEKLKLL